MRVYLGQHLYTLLTELARYADTLINIAYKTVRTNELSTDRPSRSVVKPNIPYAHAVVYRDDEN